MDVVDLAYLTSAIVAFCSFAATLLFVSQEDAARRDGQFAKDAYPANDDVRDAVRRAA